MLKRTVLDALTAFERAVYTTKSFLIALALVEGRITVEQASLASQVEVDSQIDIWGEVEDSESSFGSSSRP
jgi:ATP synthase F1 complex assembly factor 2